MSGGWPLRGSRNERIKQADGTLGGVLTRSFTFRIAWGSRYGRRSQGCYSAHRGARPLLQGFAWIRDGCAWHSDGPWAAVGGRV